jgi:hypothetical protein
MPREVLADPNVTLLAAADWAGPAGYCSPRHPPHCQTLLSSGITSRGEHDLSEATVRLKWWRGLVNAM